MRGMSRLETCFLAVAQQKSTLFYFTAFKNDSLKCKVEKATKIGLNHKSQNARSGT